MFYNKLPRGEEEKYIKLLDQAQPQIIEDPVLNYNYKPPIELVVREVITKMQEQQEDKVMEVVHYYNINVDKEELIKALAYDRDQYRKGYTDALKQMEGYRKVEQGEWISVEDELPQNDYQKAEKERKKYLVYTEPRGIMYEATFGYEENNWWVTKESIFDRVLSLDFSENVTHWKPLPQPPKMKGAE